MKENKFHEIIDFAIDREMEAVNFYYELQRSNDIKFEAQREMLQELENMERGHILTLEKMRARELDVSTIGRVKNLMISDYIVDEKVAPNSYQNILIIAMKREEKSKKLYEDLALKLGEEDSELRNLFLRLAEEESSHKLKFEKLYDEYVNREN